MQVQSSLPFIAIEKISREGPGAIVNIPQQGPTAIYELTVSPIGSGSD